MKPALTTLIKMLDKPALLSWANKIGLEGIRLNEYRKKVTGDGTSLHKQIEDYHFKNIPFKDPKHQENFDNYFKDKLILDLEEKIETDYFQGRLDLRINYKGKIYLCDFKSNHKRVYFENILQLAGYRMDSKCDGVGIISIPDFTFIPVKVEDFTPYEEILKNLSNIYKLKQTI